MKAFNLIIFLLGALAVPLTIGQEALAEGLNYKKASLKNGAQLYDNWIKIKEAEIKDTHPLYPKTSKKSGTSTWRCKECHGWDYIGKEGRYNEGSHYTGISGIYHVRNADPQNLFITLKNSAQRHDFSTFLYDNEIWDLVKFLKKGLQNIENVLDKNGIAKGDFIRGKALFNENCGSCHGEDGNDLDFKSKIEGVQGIGWLANENPQESIHKIRWGHPGSNMPSMIVDKNLSEKETIDILTYSQSLKNK